MPCRALAAASSPRQAGSKQRQWGRRRQKLGAEQPRTKQTAPAEIPRGTRKALQTRFFLMVRLSANVLPGCLLVSEPLCLEHRFPFLTCSIQSSPGQHGAPPAPSPPSVIGTPMLIPTWLHPDYVLLLPLSGRRVSAVVFVASAALVTPLWL